MVIRCKDVWREISNYLDSDISPKMREELEQHLENCRHCAALVDSTRNILLLVADERVFPLPIGFSARLRKRLEAALSD
jgi:anti-sigma factor RsiW